MGTLWLVVALASSCLLSRNAGQEADIILIPPKSVNVSLLGVAEFNCTGIADDFVWRINGVDVVNNENGFMITPTVILNAAQGIRMSTLRVTDFSTDSTRNITCVAVVVSPLAIDESEPVLLMIQGILESVSDLRLTLLNSTTVYISWSAPFTLEGVPILGYNVSIITTDKKETTLVKDTVLYYPVHPDTGNFTVVVVPINQIGSGVSATIAYAFNEQPSLGIDSFTFSATQVTVASSTITTVSVVKPSESVLPTGQGSLSTAAILGAVIGGLVGAVLLCIIIIICIIITSLCAVGSRSKHDYAGHDKDVELERYSTADCEEPDKADHKLEFQCSTDSEEPDNKPTIYEKWDIDFETAEIKLKFCVNGDFLVRYCSLEKKYALAVKWNGPVVHAFINETPKHPEILYYIDILRNKPFTSVADLIEHLVKFGERITAISPAILLKQVSRIDKWTISHNEIEILKKNLISKNGHFGKVYKAMWNGEEVAVKTCKSSRSRSDIHQFLHGIEILKQCDHDNIVKVLAVADEKYPIYSVKEMMSGGTFLKFLKREGHSCTKKQLTVMCVHVCAGMAYLERNNHIHCVLGARNCLVKWEDHNIKVKINNIGLSQEDTETRKSSFLTPPKWTAPEALRGHKYTSFSDVWSFGILLWETFSFGDIPYSDMEDEDALKWVEENAKNRMSPPVGCPESVHKVMDECWQCEAKARPTFAKLEIRLKELYESMEK